MSEVSDAKSETILETHITVWRGLWQKTGAGARPDSVIGDSAEEIDFVTRSTIENESVELTPSDFTSGTIENESVELTPSDFTSGIPEGGRGVTSVFDGGILKTILVDFEWLR